MKYWIGNENGIYVIRDNNDALIYSSKSRPNVDKFYQEINSVQKSMVNMNNFKYQDIPTGKAPNSILDKKGFYISHNRFSAGYGCETTAIVFPDILGFFGVSDCYCVLRGDHREQCKTLETIEDCIKYLKNNEENLHERSEHKNLFAHYNV